MGKVNVFKDKMWEIKGASKAKRLAWAKAADPVSWAYNKMLRETNKTRRVYDSNPYIEVYQFRDNMYGLFEPNADGAADVWMYLIVGPKRAMLIDTGFGLGDLKALCGEISNGKPVDVVLTHAGPDHCLGSFWFDKVFCYENEVKVVKDKCYPGCHDYLFDENGNNIWLQFDRADLPEYREFEVAGVPNHYVINLGEDYDIELIWTGGHDGGHAVYLDKHNRVLYTGDVIENGTCALGCNLRSDYDNSIYCNLETFRDQLTEICQRFDEFDYLFPSHYVLELENNILLYILNALNEIIADPYCYDYVGKGGKHQQYYKFVKGYGGTIRYTMEGVYFMG